MATTPKERTIIVLAENRTVIISDKRTTSDERTADVV